MRFFRVSSFFFSLRSTALSKFLKCTALPGHGSKVLAFFSNFSRRPPFGKRPFVTRSGRGGEKTVFSSALLAKYKTKWLLTRLRKVPFTMASQAMLLF